MTSEPFFEIAVADLTAGDCLPCPMFARNTNGHVDRICDAGVLLSTARIEDWRDRLSYVLIPAHMRLALADYFAGLQTAMTPSVLAIITHARLGELASAPSKATIFDGLHHSAQALTQLRHRELDSFSSERFTTLCTNLGSADTFVLSAHEYFSEGFGVLPS